MVGEKGKKKAEDSVYSAVKCDCCRRMGTRPDCVWGPGTSTSCLPCQHGRHRCTIAGMAIKSLELHHPPKIQPGVNQAIRVVADLTPITVDDPYERAEKYSYIADYMEDVLNQQGQSLSILYDIAQMARKSLLAANGEGTVGAGDAASKELSEDGDADEKAMDTDE